MDSCSEHNLKQSRIDILKITQKTVNDLDTNFIVASVQPLSVMEHDAFVKLIESLSPGKKVINRKGLCLCLDSCSKMKENLTEHLSRTDYCCTTADIWSCHNKSYLGVTVHWLEFINFTSKRFSAVSACQRFKEIHSYKYITEKLHNIHAKYNLSIMKIVNLATDNASNLQKAFTEFTADTQENKYDDDSEGDVTFDNVADILSQSQSYNNNNSDNEDDDAQDFSLPSHVKCGCHTLNLIATIDVNSALLDKKYGKLRNGAFGKCQGLWTAVRHSMKMHDTTGELSPGKKLCVGLLGF